MSRLHPQRFCLSSSRWAAQVSSFMKVPGGIYCATWAENLCFRAKTEWWLCPSPGWTEAGLRWIFLLPDCHGNLTSPNLPRMRVKWMHWVVNMWMFAWGRTKWGFGRNNLLRSYRTAECWRWGIELGRNLEILNKNCGLWGINCMKL